MILYDILGWIFQGFFYSMGVVLFAFFIGLVCFCVGGWTWKDKLIKDWCDFFDQNYGIIIEWNTLQDNNKFIKFQRYVFCYLGIFTKRIKTYLNIP